MGKRLIIQNTGSSDIIEIRAHHLLCIQGFQGYGYSWDFKRNLEEIINYLDLHPYCSLKVVADADVICVKCPHLEDGRCNKSSSPAVMDMDLKVLKKLNMEKGTIKTARKLFREVNKTFNSQDFHDICSECSWKNKCLLYQSNQTNIEMIKRVL